MVKIIYASVTGNTERVCRKIAEQLDTMRSDIPTELYSADDVDVSIFTPDNMYIIATSTWNLGEMNQFLEGLYAQLEEADLNGVKMAFIGLGDRVYGEENFCKAMRDFRERAIARGVVEVCEPLFIDGEPSMIGDEVIEEWVGSFL